MRLFAPAFALVAAIALLLAPGSAIAAEDAPTLLTVTGRIAEDGGARFDREALEAMPRYRGPLTSKARLAA